MKNKLKSIWNFFSTYEKVWFISILILSIIFAFVFPEEDINGVNGKVIMILYLLDIFFNILCELLLSKQSRWNFIVSLIVEVLEILICIVLSYRFATLATTLFFWIPVDIISFINWSRHRDYKDRDLTIVRKLSGKQEVICIISIIIWTIGVGYFITYLNIGTELFHGNELIKTIVIYLDSCVSVLGILNGLFILFRYREQWITWILSSILESIINILSGQVVLLVLKIGYLTNSIYGYIKWSKYIKTTK